MADPLRSPGADALDPPVALCPACHHPMDGLGGMCSQGWCRCVCLDAVLAEVIALRAEVARLRQEKNDDD
jgi:hypothetical protein